VPSMSAGAEAAARFSLDRGRSGRLYSPRFTCEGHYYCPGSEYADLTSVDLPSHSP
jgi:hypothetical protein